MISAVIKGPSHQEALKQIHKAHPFAHLLELRLDAFESLDLDKIAALQSSSTLPCIFTLRSKKEGGFFPGTEKERLKLIEDLAKLKPRYFDLEAAIPLSFWVQIKKKHPEIQWIASYHDSSGLPHDLDKLYQEMQKTRASLYKIAAPSTSSSEALRLLNWARGKENVIAIPMGITGQPMRLIAPIFHSKLAYGCIQEETKTDMGQVHLKEMVENYRFPLLKSGAPIFGLIGDPIDQSLSHITHNAILKQEGLEGIYVKFPVKKEELPLFLKRAKEGPFRGLSVTQPLKQAVLPLLDDASPEVWEIGAANTLTFNQGKIYGSNTDGLGALYAIERKMKIRGKKVILVGCGGAARAVAYELKKRGAELTILNRTPEKADELASRLKCRFSSLHDLPKNYELIINATGPNLPIDPEAFKKGAFAMDLTTVPKDTPFLRAAVEYACRPIYGYQMFAEQAALQFLTWFGPRISPEKIRSQIEILALEPQIFKRP